MRLPVIAVLWLGSLLVAAQDNGHGDDLSTLIQEVFGGKDQGQPDDTNKNQKRNDDLTNNVGNHDVNNKEGGSSVPGSDKCECVPYYLCANNSIITDGTGILDIRLKGDLCESYLDVCCGKPLPSEEAIKPIQRGRRGCGTRNIDGVGFRITGAIDNESQFGEFPWMIAILLDENFENANVKTYQCGGALIHERVVLTAAHCVQRKSSSPLLVRAGEWDTQTKNELYPHQDRQVEEIIIHEDYYAGALYNDIALLVLKEPFTFADNVDIICLPKQGDVVLNKECSASGWGKDVFGKEFDKTEPAPSPSIKTPILGSVQNVIQVKINKFKDLFLPKPKMEHSTLRPLDKIIKEKIDKFTNLFHPTKRAKTVTEAPKAQWINLDERMGSGVPSSENPLKFPDSGKKGKYQVILKKVDLPMVDRNTCEAELRKTRLSQYFNLHESFVCAGGIAGQDTCKGDGGSPLVCPVPGEKYKYQQVGIVAWGIGCGNETPAVYVNVAHFRKWIDDHFKRLNLIPEYTY
ncbi:hyaluronan-binding protein 2 isoform X1 [Cimex lectularius]|uniref:Peptidase S1 domain-containing protein n=1 Tax=Cimex lectularius TaxID=79782 RepID=A0A8I6SC33_CIMLE|nr:hyaluronan-binding protein 2 isoform X1 [Cimex lectularius]